MKLFLPALALTACLASVRGDYDEEDSYGGSPVQSYGGGGGGRVIPLSNEMKQYIVEKHNYARAYLVPEQACNMRQVTWDNHLEQTAQQWASICIHDHKTDGYGQNLYWESGANDVTKSVVDGWMKGWVDDELRDDGYFKNGNLPLNHASAILWADTHLVGCGSALCGGTLHTACHYLSVPNIRGAPAFVPGPSCSNCPSEAPYCDATGKLCVATQDGGYGGYGPEPVKPTSKPTSKPAYGSKDSDDDDNSYGPTKKPSTAPSTAPPAYKNTTAPTPAPTPCKNTTTAPTPAPTPCKSTTAPTPAPTTVAPRHDQC